MSGVLHGGGIDAARAAFPGAPSPWIDLSTGINPWPYRLPPLAPELSQRLPDRDLDAAARTAAAGAFGCDPAHILLTAGSQAAIALLPAVLRARRVAIVGPTYGEHSAAWQRAGALVEPYPDLPGSGHADVVVVCNPNNPDGRSWQPSRLLAQASDLADRGGVLVVDEAFCDLTPDLSVAKAVGQGGLIVLRSFGKFYGLAGVRLGALVAAPPLLERAAEALGPWAVSGPALEVARVAYADADWAQATRTRLAEAAAQLDAVLSQAEFTVEGGTSLFRWTRHGDAAGLWRRLAKAGLLVRSFADRPDRLRFGLLPDKAARRRLKKALG